MPYAPKKNEPKNLGEAIDLLLSFAFALEDDEIKMSRDKALEIDQLVKQAYRIEEKNRRYYYVPDC